MLAEPRRYQVILSRQARKMLTRLPTDLAQQAHCILDALRNEPRPRGAIKLRGQDLYRVRVRTWRIVYQVKDRELLVLVVKIASRGHAYDQL